MSTTAAPEAQTQEQTKLPDLPERIEMTSTADDLVELVALEAEHLRALKGRVDGLDSADWRSKLDAIDLEKLTRMEADLVRLQKREKEARRVRLSDDEIPIHKRQQLKDAIHRAFTLPRSGGIPADAGAKWGPQLTAEHTLLLTPTEDPLLEEFKLYNDLLYIQRWAAFWQNGYVHVDPTTLPTWKPWAGIWHRAYAELLDTAESGGGTEWVPTMFSSQFVQLYRLRGDVQNLFRRFPMTSKTWELPRVSAAATASQIAETTAKHTAQIPSTPAPSSGTTTKVTFTAWKMGLFMAMSGEWIEDSSVDSLMYAREEIAQAYADGEEKSLVNGDTAGTHMDTDTNAGASTLVEKQVLGLRAKALDDSKTVDAGGNDLTDDDLITCRGVIGKYGVRPSEIAYLVSPMGHTDLLKDTDLKTMYAIGALASSVRGAVTSVGGVPVMVSEHVREDVNNTGVNGASGNTFTTANVFNHRRMGIGDRRAVTLEPVRNAFYDTNWLVVMGRWDFQIFETGVSGLVYDVPNT